MEDIEGKLTQEFVESIEHVDGRDRQGVLLGALADTGGDSQLDGVVHLLRPRLDTHSKLQHNRGLGLEKLGHGSGMGGEAHFAIEAAKEIPHDNRPDSRLVPLAQSKQ
jgi:hypothetical protein